MKPRYSNKPSAFKNDSRKIVPRYTKLGAKAKSTPTGPAPNDDPLNRGFGASDRGTIPTLRKCTGYKDRAVLPASTSWTDQEYNVLAAL
jgi:hypothetical protein